MNPDREKKRWRKMDEDGIYTRIQKIVNKGQLSY